MKSKMATSSEFWTALGTRRGRGGSDDGTRSFSVHAHPITSVLLFAVALKMAEIGGETWICERRRDREEDGGDLGRRRCCCSERGVDGDDEDICDGLRSVDADLFSRNVDEDNDGSCWRC